MAQPTLDISLRLAVLNARGEHLGGTIDLSLKPLGGGDPRVIRGADASKDIDIGGLPRTPNARYEITIMPTGSTSGAKEMADIPRFHRIPTEVAMETFMCGGAGSSCMDDFSGKNSRYGYCGGYVVTTQTI